MKEITLKVDGMMCGMCEAHANDAIRNNFKVKKVSSSHTKGETVIITENDISDKELTEAIEKAGYKVASIERREYVKGGFFTSLFKKNKMKKDIVKTKNWLLDFDGTLVDSMKYCAPAVVKILDENGVKYRDDIVSFITPLGMKGTAEYFVEIGLKMSYEELEKETNDRLVPLYENVITEKKGVKECLFKMKDAGYKLYILSASPHIMIDPCIKRLGLADCFEKVWSSDDFGMGKTNPEIYRLAAERMGTTVNDVTFLDDNMGAVKTAKEAGMQVIGVYDISSKNNENAIKDIADGYIYEISELQEALFN